MEIPDKVKDAVLTSMADYYLEESPPFESELDVEQEVKQKSKGKPARNPVQIQGTRARPTRHFAVRRRIAHVHDACTLARTVARADRVV